MKKKRFYSGMILMALLVAVLAGCGGGGGKGPSDPPPNTIYFEMPSSYYDSAEGKYYSLPEDKPVKFYILTKLIYDAINNDPDNSKYEADYVFTGTTGKSTLGFTLPAHLKGQQRYIYAVVELKGSYDLREKIESEAETDADAGNILFGQAIDIIRNDGALVTLTNGRRIGNFEFYGKGDGEKLSEFTFKMPATYKVGDSTEFLPGEKVVKFYSLANTDSETINADDYTFTGITGRGDINGVLPSFLAGQNRYFYALIYLTDDSSFDLDGKNKQQLYNAIQRGEVLFGQSKDPINENKLYTLTEGVIIDNFEFIGPTPDGVINFTIPTTCISGAPIPSGKDVKFYALKNTNVPLNADHVFTGTTGSNNIQCTLPGSLIGKECYFFAVVNIKGSFDLQGKTEQLLRSAIERGDVLFGKSINSEDPDNNKLYTLTNGINIENFEFVDASFSEASIINFAMPSFYYTGADNTLPVAVPSGKIVKFYTLTEAAYNNLRDNASATINEDHIFSGTTGDSNLRLTLPDFLKNQNRYIFAVVILNGSFDLHGKNLSQLQTAIRNGEVVFGKATDLSGDSRLVTLTSGSTIDFTFSTYIPPEEE